MMMTNEFSDRVKQVDIEAFLDDFDSKCAGFRKHCDQYLRREIDISAITRHLSEATADAEMFFAEHSFYMTIEQLQRYGSIQKVFDNLTFQLFETEIDRNRAVILDALVNGDYFIISLMFNAIKSSYYMMYSKHKIKTEQNQKLADLEKEFESTQAIVKVLKAFEGIIKTEDAAQLDLIKVQKILEIYISHFSQLDQMRTRIACDQRLFLLFKNHQEFLARQDLNNEGVLRHLLLCCHIIEPLAQDHEDLRVIWQGWRNELTGRLWTQNPEGSTQSEVASTQFEDKAPLILQILDHIEAATRPAEATLLDYHTIQLELKNYVEIIAKVEAHPGISDWDDRAFSLLEEHVDFLDSINFGGAPAIVAKHLSDCCDMLQNRVQKPFQQHLLDAWRAISSTMSHSERVGKSKLIISDQLNSKRQQELQWARIESELEAGQVLIQALNILENVLAVESVDPVDFQMIQKSLLHYTEVIRTQDATTPTRRVCDERLFNVFGEYIDLLYAHQTIINMAILAAHINTCINLLKSVAQDQVHWQMLIVWRSIKDDLLNKFAANTKQKQAEKHLSLALFPFQGKASQESGVPPTEDDFEAQALLKMVAVLDSLLSAEHGANLDYSGIQQALRRYVAASNVLGTQSLRSICHEKTFSLFEAHIDSLFENGLTAQSDQHSEHLEACCNLLDIIAENKMQLQMMSVWRSL